MRGKEVRVSFLICKKKSILNENPEDDGGKLTQLALTWLKLSVSSIWRERRMLKTTLMSHLSVLWAVFDHFSNRHVHAFLTQWLVICVTFNWQPESEASLQDLFLFLFLLEQFLTFFMWSSTEKSFPCILCIISLPPLFLSLDSFFTPCCNNYRQLETVLPGIIIHQNKPECDARLLTPSEDRSVICFSKFSENFVLMTQ